MEKWRHCLIKESQSEQCILQIIKRSIKDEAFKVILRLKIGAKVQEIWSKLDSVYGDDGVIFWLDFIALRKKMIRPVLHGVVAFGKFYVKQKLGRVQDQAQMRCYALCYTKVLGRKIETEHPVQSTSMPKLQ